MSQIIIYGAQVFTLKQLGYAVLDRCGYMFYTMLSNKN